MLNYKAGYLATWGCPCVVMMSLGSVPVAVNRCLRPQGYSACWILTLPNPPSSPPPPLYNLLFRSFLHQYWVPDAQTTCKIFLDVERNPKRYRGLTRIRTGVTGKVRFWWFKIWEGIRSGRRRALGQTYPVWSPLHYKTVDGLFKLYNLNGACFTPKFWIYNIESDTKNGKISQNLVPGLRGTFGDHKPRARWTILRFPDWTEKRREQQGLI